MTEEEQDATNVINREELLDRIAEWIGDSHLSSPRAGRLLEELEARYLDEDELRGVVDELVRGPAPVDDERQLATKLPITHADNRRDGDGRPMPRVMRAYYDEAVSLGLDDPLGRAAYAYNRSKNASKSIENIRRAKPSTAERWRIHWLVGGSMKSLSESHQEYLKKRRTEARHRRDETTLAWYARVERALLDPADQLPVHRGRYWSIRVAEWLVLHDTRVGGEPNQSGVPWRHTHYRTWKVLPHVRSAVARAVRRFYRQSAIGSSVLKQRRGSGR